MPERYGRVVAPIYRSDSMSRPDYVGTGVLVRDASNYWLLSAAHVFGEHDPLWLPTAPAFKRVRSTIRSDKYSTDPLDLSFIELNFPEAAGLESAGYEFLPISAAQITASEYPEGRCAILGYPAAGGVTINHDSESIDYRALIARSNFVKRSKVSLLRLDPKVKLVIKYEDFSEDVTGKKIGIPIPSGLSGGAIWSCPKDAEPVLVGILTEWDRKKKILIGTQLWPMIRQIALRLRARANE